MRHLMLIATTALVLAAPQVADAGGSGETIEWIRDFAVARDQAQATGRPILINFYCGT